MSHPSLTVVLSQAPGNHPGKRTVEEALAAALRGVPDLEVVMIPHLSHLGSGHPARQFLQSVSGNLVFLSWLSPRAAFWLLDFLGVKGCLGTPTATTNGTPEVSNRSISCFALREGTGQESLVDQIKGILGQGLYGPRNELPPSEQGHWTAAQILEAPGRRWYPVIDYSRCTNCMECIDFCLFGVYGVDRQDRILVESPDSCKKGCPACSRVCPEQAIIFPDHKTPAIAGAANERLGPRKIDLTQLFGGADMLRLASEERARELNQDGQKTHPKDDLDKLMDALDALDL